MKQKKRIRRLALLVVCDNKNCRVLFKMPPCKYERSFNHFCSRKCHSVFDTGSGDFERNRLLAVCRAAFSRCYRPKDKAYKNYGARGIRISDEFLNIDVFVEHIRNLPNYPKKGGTERTLDRVDNDRGYERGNLRWATFAVQIANKRKLSTNKSGYVGVIRVQNASTWRAYISHKKIHHDIACFKTKEEAVTARNNYIKSHHLPHKIQSI